MGISKLTISGIGSTGATVAWTTDVPSSTELDFGPVDASGNWTAARLPALGADTTSHVYPLTGLAPSSAYRVQAQSYDGTNTFSYLPCDDGSSPSDFSTTAASGPASVLAVTASPTQISVGQTSQLTVAASSATGSASGRVVKFDIHNGKDRGTFSQNPATTDGNGNASVTFTAAKNGKAQIQVLVDTASHDVDVMVN
jgi:hypothetical protein